MIDIPPRFLDVHYNGARFPGAAGIEGLDGGANCQRYAYELLRHFGKDIPNFRSSDLWEDEAHTTAVTSFEPLDLLLFTDRDDSWGAHVAVYVGEGRALHLCKAIGKPVIWTIDEFLSTPKYCRLIGGKRVL